ncbi:MAG: hypothetical protein F6K39_30310, partial [Okeania sp. SIO3B3]|nr:hypothetical protein [Okeania sp. SIO3B3]
CLPSCRDTRAWELYKLFVHGAGLPNNPPEKETSREDLRDIAHYCLHAVECYESVSLDADAEAADETGIS